VRVFQDFATLDLISQGRAEMVVGRGSFIESFPLFHPKVEDYDSLFTEKLYLLLELRNSTNITWSGKYRAAVTGRASTHVLSSRRSPSGSASQARRSRLSAQDSSVSHL
jgi:alkanesulfonate monooxygenase SsuD/methylene tetrahydromethanopterin reductase-like flavin-dependent oxidoreductase (luciferase family)